MPKNTANGYATKADLRRLEKRIDKRFEQVDKRFEQVDKRFESMNDRFRWLRSEIKDELDLWKKDTFREFEHRWQQLIDPVLHEIQAIREEYTAHQGHHRRMEDILEKIAAKVGVKV